MKRVVIPLYIIKRMKKIIKHEHYLRLLADKKCDPKIRTALLKYKPLNHTLCEICLNVLRGTVKASPQLNKYKKLIRMLAKGKCIRKLQTGGAAFLPVLLAPIISLLAEKLISRFTNKGN